MSFTGNGMGLSSCKLYLTKINNVSEGYLVAELYLETHSSGFGIDSKPTGSVLATSNQVTVVSLSKWTNISLALFTFDGTFKLINGTKYVIACHKVNGFDNSSNWVGMGLDQTSVPSNIGNESYYNGSMWVAEDNKAMCFYVYGTPLPVDLAGNISAGASLSGDLKGSVLIAGNISAKASLAADLKGFVSMAGNIFAGASLSGDLNIGITNAIFESLEKYFAGFSKRGIISTVEPSTQIKETIPPAINSTEAIQDRIDKYYAFSNG